MTTPIAHARAASDIARALATMMEQPRAFGPFVIVTDVETNRFVQFRGSDAESLLIDVPALGWSSILHEMPPDEAAELALATLTVRLRCRLGRGIRVERHPSPNATN